MILFLGNSFSIVFFVFLLFFLEIVMIGFRSKKSVELQTWKNKNEKMNIELQISNEIEIGK